MAKKTHDLYLKSHHSNFEKGETMAMEKGESKNMERMEKKMGTERPMMHAKTENKNWKGRKFPSKV